MKPDLKLVKLLVVAVFVLGFLLELLPNASANLPTPWELYRVRRKFTNATGVNTSGTFATVETCAYYDVYMSDGSVGSTSPDCTETVSP